MTHTLFSNIFFTLYFIHHIFFISTFIFFIFTLKFIIHIWRQLSILRIFHFWTRGNQFWNVGTNFEPLRLNLIHYSYRDSKTMYLYIFTLFATIHSNTGTYSTWYQSHHLKFNLSLKHVSLTVSRDWLWWQVQ